MTAEEIVLELGLPKWHVSLTEDRVSTHYVQTKIQQLSALRTEAADFMAEVRSQINQHKSILANMELEWKLLIDNELLYGDKSGNVTDRKMKAEEKAEQTLAKPTLWSKWETAWINRYPDQPFTEKEFSVLWERVNPLERPSRRREMQEIENKLNDWTTAKDIVQYKIDEIKQLDSAVRLQSQSLGQVGSYAARMPSNVTTNGSLPHGNRQDSVASFEDLGLKSKVEP